MAKLTKRAAELHLRAADLVAKDRALTEDEKEFVLDHWQESAATVNTVDGAFFTPPGLAVDLSIEVLGKRIVDLGAGIGHLASACRALLMPSHRLAPCELVCVERNPTFVMVGRKVLPEAEWICADMFDLPEMSLDPFDTAISNPPFGFLSGMRRGPRYRGRRAEYRVIDLASQVARRGVFIVPQVSAPFRCSGREGFTYERTTECVEFESTTGIVLDNGCSIDTSIYRHEWRGVSPMVEIVTCDFIDMLRDDGPPGTPLPGPSASAPAATPAPVRHPARSSGEDQLSLFTNDSDRAHR